MKITRKQLRTLIESELKSMLSEDSGQEEGEHYTKNRKADEEELEDIEHHEDELKKDIRYDDRHINENNSRSLLNEEEYDCIKDYMAMGYSRREAQAECRGSASQARHPLDVDGDGELTIKEGTPTEEMPAAWQQVLGNILD